MGAEDYKNGTRVDEEVSVRRVQLNSKWVYFAILLVRLTKICLGA